MKHITVKVKNVYGNPVAYPACEMSEVFARIAGTKTLTAETLRLIASLGFTVKQIITL
jgi:hypothetical protein